MRVGADVRGVRKVDDTAVLGDVAASDKRLGHAGSLYSDQDHHHYHRQKQVWVNWGESILLEH